VEALYGRGMQDGKEECTWRMQEQRL